MQRRRLPRLDILPVHALVLHEDVESHRVNRILWRIAGDGFLQNPPIVGTNNADSRYIVLDGASRVTAARRLRLPHLLVQVVDYPSPKILLDRWHHQVVGMSLETLVARAEKIRSLVLEPIASRDISAALEGGDILACLRAPHRRAVAVRSADPESRRMRPLRELTRLYATDPGLHRVREDQVEFPEEWLGEKRVLVHFRRFTQEDIVHLALHVSDRLPMGITRHLVRNRALRLFYPLDELRAKIPLADKQRRLKRFLEAKWEKGRIRYYPEPTTLYDE